MNYFAKVKSLPKNNRSFNSVEFEALCLDELKRIERARSNLLDFTTYTKPDYEVNDHHKIITHFIDKWVKGEIERLMVFAPPRHGKSELVSRRLPAYILGLNPNANVISTSYSQSLASRMNRDCQRVIDSPEFIRLFPNTRLPSKETRAFSKGARTRTNSMFEIVNHRGDYRSAGVGGGITGMGGTHVIIDDPVKNAEDANSVIMREKAWEWYMSTLYTRLEKNARILITMTRWHEDDLAGRLLEHAKKSENADQWTVVVLPAVCEEPNEYDKREVGEALWRNKYSEERLLKTKGSIVPNKWNSLFQQRPAAKEGDLFKRKHWRFYRELPPNIDLFIQSWDFAVKDKAVNDYTVGQVWGKKGSNIFLIHQFRDKVGFRKGIEALIHVSANYPQAIKKLIEDKANGSPAIEILENKMSGIIRVNPRASKLERAIAVYPYIEAGNVWLPDPKIFPWVYDFIEEHAIFPNGKNDDQVDTTTQALKELGASNAIQTMEEFLRM